jgi:hypothetical protein
MGETGRAASFSFPASLRVSPSRRVWALLFFLHGLSLAVLGVWVSSLFVGSVVAIGLGLSAWHFHRQWKKGHLELRLESDGRLFWRHPEVSDMQLGQACPHSTDWGFAIWLGFIPPSGSEQAHAQYWFLMPDGFDPADWRLLRIWLKHMALPTHPPLPTSNTRPLRTRKQNETD